jgi:C4-dicarboxylate transporter, DctM subunit
VHFGIVVTLTLAIGQQTPPVASVRVLHRTDVSRANVPFVAVLVAVLLLVTYLPAIPLALAELFYR